MKKKILILGSSGRLGSYLFNNINKKKYDIFYYNRNQNPNINFNNNTIFNFLSKIQPNIIINTIAITNIEYCENNYDEAYNVNSMFV